MEKYETNSSLIINFFKKNYIKMIVFVMVSIIISISLTISNNKKLDLLYSNFTVIFNDKGYAAYALKKLGNLHYDFIYFLEKRGLRNNKVFHSRHTSNIIQLEIKHKDLNDKGTKQYDEYLNIVEDYKERLNLKLDSYSASYIERFNIKISDANDDLTKENVASIYNNQIEFSTNLEMLRKAISNDDLFYVSYDGIIHSKQKNNILKNATISLCISIMIILLILWTKIFLREIKETHK